MTPPTYLDRLMQGLRALVRAEVPRLSYLGLYEATVNAVAHDGSTADVTPTLTSLPPIPKVPLQSSILGEIVTIKVGATRYTSIEALTRFAALLDGRRVEDLVAPELPPFHRTPAERRAAVARAAAELRKAGFM